MTVGQCFERDAEGDKAEALPLIRLFTVGKNVSYAPLDDLEAPHQAWTVSGREVRCRVVVWVRLLVCKEGRGLINRLTDSRLTDTCVLCTP